MTNSPAVVLAIGLGPFNLGLAALAHSLPDVDVVGLDKASEFCWHPGMMLPEATIQVPFLADLVTFADPTSPLSFLNYLKSRGELYNFYIRESFYPFRSEYSNYCAWVAEQLPGLHWQRTVDKVTWDEESQVYSAHTTGPHGPEEFHGTHVAIGTGTRPLLPADWPSDDRILHTSDYLAKRKDILHQESVTVVGSGQSASEVYLDLLRCHPGQVNWYTRSSRHHPMDVTQLTLEMTSPDYLDYFHTLPDSAMSQLNRDEVHLYRGTSAKTLEEIYHALEGKRVQGKEVGEILTNVEVSGVTASARDLSLELTHNITGQCEPRRTNYMVCGVGYQHPKLDILSGLQGLDFDDVGRVNADRYGCLHGSEDRIFSQNTHAWRHHLTGPDLGMGAYRNSLILNRVAGRDAYQVEKRFAHQRFGLPEKP